MNRTDQKRISLQWKKTAERRLYRALGEWRDEIVKPFRIGQERIDRETMDMFIRILRKSQIDAARDVVGIDVREYKQLDDELIERIYRDVAMQVLDVSYGHNIESAASVQGTATGWVRRVNQLAIDNEWSRREAQTALANYLRGQSLTIATSESGWIIENVRRSVVVNVRDPLGNTIQQIIDLLRVGDARGARQLSNQVVKLARMPLSVKEGQIVRYIHDARDRLVTPENQARIIDIMERQGAELGSSMKEWYAVGDEKTRPSHMAADGQTVPVDAPFVLEGGVMQYPGDGSLGAALSEIINCRCASVYV